MRKLIFMLAFLFSLGMHVVNAQTTITGAVTDANGEAVPGANVMVKGYSDIGTITDLNGNFTINVPTEATTLVFSFVGMKTTEVEIDGKTVINFAFQTDDIVVNEVVVTALGITREKKALGYAVSDISASEIQDKPESDMVRLLSGKSSGVKVTSTSGVSGTGTNIVIRGYSSISGSNQPLFIVDGVRFGSSTNSGTDDNQGFLEGNQTTSSRSLDLDPSNIENVSILKGLSATTIYGNEGRNGVILITTKGGSAKKSNKGFEVTFNQSFFNSVVNLPEYQTTYGCGFQQTDGFFFSNWGPKMDPNNPLIVPHPIRNMPAAIRDEFPEYMDATYEVKYYDNAKNFFRKGSVSSTAVGFNGANENGSYSVNASYVKDIGFVPGNELDKFGLGMGGSTALANKLKLSGTLNFVKTDMMSPPITAGNGSGTTGANGSSIFSDIFYTPVSVDLMGLPFETPITHNSVYYRAGNDIQNPRWTAKYAKTIDNVMRFFGSGSAGYEIIDNLIVNYKYGVDYYAEKQEYQLNPGSVQDDQYANGLLRTREIASTTWDNSVTINWKKEIASNFTLDLMVGGSAVRELFRQDGMESTDQLVFGFMNHKNFINHSTINGFNLLPLQSESEANTLGLFAQASFDYKSYLYLNIAGRNDWFSSLEKDNRSLFYPSVSVSFIPTQLFEQITSQNGLNFAKLRVGYGTSAGFPSLYSTRDVLGSSARSFVTGTGTVVPTNSVSFALGNPDLKPELHKEIEFGVEAKGLNHRVGIDFTYYHKTTKDLITYSNLDPSSGYTFTTVNIGSIVNTGVEIELGLTPIKFKDLQWDLSLMFTKYKSEVTELSEGQDQIMINGYTNLGNFAKVGQPYGIMMGNGIKRNADGEALIDGTGYYINSDEIEVIGDPTPDFETTMTSTLKYKGFSFFMQWDYRQGGDIYSTTAAALYARGITKDTDFDRMQTWVLPGISEDTGLPNEVQVTTTNMFFNNVGIAAPSGCNVWDGTTVRLREISLTYSVPSKFLAKTPFGSGSISLIGSNLWYKAVNFPKYMNFDTDMLSLGVGNGLGFDFMTGPSTKRYGFSLKLTF